MNKNNKVLLSAVLIILVALVAFNFGDITSKAVKDSAMIIVFPTSVSFGEYEQAKILTVKVIPNKDGIDPKMNLYQEKGLRVAGETLNICSDSTCYDEVTLTYRVSADLVSGKYFFQAERAKKQQVFKSNTFEVK